MALPDVAASFTGRRWIWRGDQSDVSAVERLAAAIAQRHGVPEAAARLLADRGLDAETAGDFLVPRLREQLPDPSSLRDMDAAAERIVAAIRAGEPIAVFGDYDVDGATASSLLHRYLTAAGASVTVYIPDRLAEGYGPNGPALRRLREAGAVLCITVDCGITAYGPLEEAAAVGLDMIVVDHHQAEPALPIARAVVNPNRLDDESGQGVLAAVGVAFLLAVAVNRALRRAGHFAARPEPDLLQMLDLVAVGTVCDVVPLTGLNRALVAQGLKVLAARGNTGLAALAEIAGLDGPANAYHLGFVLGPRINAGGRVGAADLGARLLRTHDPAEARELASRLHGLNEERRALEAGTLAAAIARVEQGKGVADGLIMVSDPGWHPGVVGIVAARLKDRYHRPVFVGAGTGEIKASGRSVTGVDLGAAVTAARQAGLLVNGGGHRMAAGITVAADKLADVHAFLAARIGDQTDGRPLVPTLTIDAALSLGGAGLPVIDAVDRLEPFGSANPRPRFGWFDVRLARVEPVGSGGDHLRCRLTDASGAQAKAMVFRAMQSSLGERLLAARDRPVHIAGTLRRDRWRGTETALLTLDDAADA